MAELEIKTNIPGENRIVMAKRRFELRGTQVLPGITRHELKNALTILTPDILGQFADVFEVFNGFADNDYDQGSMIRLWSSQEVALLLREIGNTSKRLAVGDFLIGSWYFHLDIETGAISRENDGTTVSSSLSEFVEAISDGWFDF